MGSPLSPEGGSESGGAAGGIRIASWNRMSSGDQQSVARWGPAHGTLCRDSPRMTQVSSPGAWTGLKALVTCVVCVHVSVCLSVFPRGGLLAFCRSWGMSACTREEPGDVKTPASGVTQTWFNSCLL